MPGMAQVVDTKEEADEVVEALLRRYPAAGYGTMHRAYEHDGKWHVTAHWWGAD